MTVRVLIADDNALLRTGLAAVIASDPEFEVVGEAASGPEALAAAAKQRPDLVLMDVEMPGGNGIAAIAELSTRQPQVRCLVLTMFDLDEYVVDALRAGAAGFLLKTTEPRALLRALRDCAEGRTALSPAVLDRLVASFVNRPGPVERPAWLSELTPREREVLCSLAGGRSNAEIARHLHLAETTVKTHVARVFAKLQVRDRVQATVLAHQFSLVPGQASPHISSSGS